MAIQGQEKFTAPAKDEVYSLLSNHRRRYALHYLKRADGPVTIGELADQIAAWEHEKPVSAVTSAERKRVYTSLQQTHLPNLEQAGIIELDRDAITLTEEVTELEVYLDIVPGGSIPWGVYYLGLSLLGAAVFIAVWTGIIPDEPVSPLAWMGLILGIFLVSSVFHFLSNRRYRLGRDEGPPP